MLQRDLWLHLGKQVEASERMVCDTLESILELLLVPPLSSIEIGSGLTDLPGTCSSHCLSYLFWTPREPLGAFERPLLFPRSGREPWLWYEPLPPTLCCSYRDLED